MKSIKHHIENNAFPKLPNIEYRLYSKIISKLIEPLRIQIIVQLNDNCDSILNSKDNYEIKFK